MRKYLKEYDLIYYFFLKFLKRFYLFLERDEGKEKEKTMCGGLSHAPYWGPGLQPRHVSWLGIEPTILWLAGPHSIHWTTPARVYNFFKKNFIYIIDIYYSVSLRSAIDLYIVIWLPQHWLTPPSHHIIILFLWWEQLSSSFLATLKFIIQDSCL